MLVNDAAQTALAREVALELLGPQRVELQGPPLTGSEDFAFMLERVPGSYLLIGNGDGEGPGAVPLHNARYDFNDELLPVGARFFAEIARVRLPAWKGP